MAPTVEALAEKAGVSLFDYQQEFLEQAAMTVGHPRWCLYYKTGAGKSLTALAAIALMGHTEVLVICPPSTHRQWTELGVRLGVHVTPMSHAKFRMKDTKVSRHQAIIADEFHLFGGQQGMGWRKLDKLAQHLEAPLILASATPNYNDAERCYCIQHILDPHGTKGGFLNFIYQHCDTEQNPFGMFPRVLGFKNHASAADYLAAMPGVHYLPDDLVFTIQDILYDEMIGTSLLHYGYNRRKHRMMASWIEKMHAIRYQGLVDEHGFLHPHIMDEVEKLLFTSASVLIYAHHATIAEAVSRSLAREGLDHILITGGLTKVQKEKFVQMFLKKAHPILIGTATLATGTDGLDRVCDTLLILDDTDDEALRRQLVGRIMPRGDFTSTAGKQVYRLVPLPS